MRMMRHLYATLLRVVLLATFTSGIVLLTGCSSSFMGNAVSSGGAGVGLKGMIHGGQQPVSGAHIYLYASGSVGYGSASVSLLTPGLNGVSTDGSGNGYVTTDAGGFFSITGDWSCVHGADQVYVLAVGGNPGLVAGTNNTAIVLMAAVGTCSGLTQRTFIFVNELSTVAAGTALQQFMTDGTHVGTSATNPVGLANAFASVGNLVDLSSGTAFLNTPSGNGTAPQAELNTLANILAPCVSSAGSTSVGCSALFSASTPSGGSTPTDTLMAALSIARNPANNVAALYALPTPTSPFQPMLGGAPNDWTIGITYGLGQNSSVGDVEIDANGNVWATSCATCVSNTPDAIVELTTTGSVLSGTGFTGGGAIHNSFALAIDSSGSIWVSNDVIGSSAENVTKLTNAGTLAAGFPVTGSGVSGPAGIAIDSSGAAWVANADNHTIAKIATDGTLLSGGGYTSPGLDYPAYVAVDSTGSVWITGFFSSSLLKLATDGTVLSGDGAGYMGGGLDGPNGVAIDGAGNIWITNAGQIPSTISKFTNTGTPISGSSGYGIGVQDYAPLISIDGAGTVWSATCNANCGTPGPGAVVHLATDGTLLTPPSGYLNGGLDSPFSQAIDGSGNLWVANGYGGTITELVGVAAPVKTPVAAAVASNLLGQRP
jgi:hypothetical protein